MSTLDDFAAARVQVGEFLRTQRASIGHFWDKNDNVFFRTEGDRQEADSTLQRQPVVRVHRLTSTVTCLESLLEAPRWDCDPGERWTNDHALDVLRKFIGHALTTQEGWSSDDAAWVYCRVRTLGAALRLLANADGWDDTSKNNARSLIEDAWRSRYDAGGSFGLREATSDPRTSGKLETRSGPKQYPPNAFLTYWGLLAADVASKLGVIDDGSESPASERARSAALDWMRESLASQVAFQYTDSRFADPQQLAWSLCGLVRFGDPNAVSNAVSVEHELLLAGLRAFFGQQKNGTWPTGAPLFHYRNAGNAYTYTYETLGELVCLASSRDIEQVAAAALADALKGYSSELMEALQHATSTGQMLNPERVGWSSGHHPHRNSPESWATASVYRFAQGLRRLIGIWSNQDAKAALGARRPGSNIVTLANRGASWDLGHGTAGGFLSTAFVHPVLKAIRQSENQSRVWWDPDEQILSDDQARSAMLFGPPGTGKTTLVEAVAGAIGWDYVEITPAQFLDRGVDYVSARADVIFRQAMELDHCVVLLDEIDELIQQRSSEAETIERFFTTTMLPRLAKLWDAGRILFFVNTNNISRVDSAIVRSQRFDAARMILPPGYSSKAAWFNSNGHDLQVTENDINTALLEPGGIAPNRAGIGWLALIRYDQYNAIRRALIEQGVTSGAVSEDQLSAAVQNVARELRRLDWHDETEWNEDESGIPLPNVADQFGFERKDARMEMWADASALQASTVDRVLADEDRAKDERSFYEDRGTAWLAIGAPESPERWAIERGLTLRPDGKLAEELSADGNPPVRSSTVDQAGTEQPVAGSPKDAAAADTLTPSDGAADAGGPQPSIP